MAVFMNDHTDAGQSHLDLVTRLFVHVHCAAQFAGTSIPGNIQRIRPASQIYNRVHRARLRPNRPLLIRIRRTHARKNHIDIVDRLVLVVVVLAKVNIAPVLYDVDSLGKSGIRSLFCPIIISRIRKRHGSRHVDCRLEHTHGVLDKVLANAPAHPVSGIAVIAHIALKILLRRRRLELYIAELHENHQHIGLALRDVLFERRAGRHRERIV